MYELLFNTKSNITVGTFIKELKKLPSDCKISLTGMDSFGIAFDREKQVVLLDNTSYIEELVEEQETFKFTISHLISLDFKGDLEGEMMGYIPDTLKIVEETHFDDTEQGYVVVEAEYDDLNKVSFYDKKEHRTYYLDTYIKAVGNDGNEVLCIKTMSPNKDECLLLDVSKELQKRNNRSH